MEKFNTFDYTLYIYSASNIIRKNKPTKLNIQNIFSFKYNLNHFIALKKTWGMNGKHDKFRDTRQSATTEPGG